MLIALVLLALTGTEIDKIIISMVAVQWAWFARTALIERRKEYSEAATALGLSPMRIVLHHLLPNCPPPLIVIAPLRVAGVGHEEDRQVDLKFRVAVVGDHDAACEVGMA